MSTSKDIQAGDVVKLASGGQKMTVGGTPGTNGFVTCCWFRDQGAKAKENYGDFVSEQIPLEALVKVEPGTSIEDF